MNILQSTILQKYSFNNVYRQFIFYILLFIDIFAVKKKQNKMTRNRFTLYIIVVFAMQSACISAQIVTRTIKDIENGMPVPYAAIYKSDSILLSNANVDGIFSINVTPGSFYEVTRIGYKSVTLTAEQLLSDKVIKMEMLPYELNTVVVTASSAVSDLNRALEAARKRIPSTPFFMRCYKKDEVIVGNDTLLNAKAITDFNIRKVFSAGKDFRGYASFKELYIDYNISYSEDIIPIADQSPKIPMNGGFSLQADENLIFTRFNSDNDSITIIAFHPKKNQHSKGRTLTSGRFIIDTRTWCILRFDITPDLGTIEYHNHMTETSHKRRMREHRLSIFFSENCLPSKVEQKTVYYLEDKPDELFTWTVLQVYKDITKAEYQQKPSGPYDWEKFILQQKPVDIPDFDTHYNQGFQ